MKKIAAVLIMLLVLSTSAFAVGTVTVTKDIANVLGQRDKIVLTLAWTADASARPRGTGMSHATSPSA